MNEAAVKQRNFHPFFFFCIPNSAHKRFQGKLTLQSLHPPLLIIAVVILNILTICGFTPAENIDLIVLLLINCDSSYHGLLNKEKE